jgi:RNA polymerase sigma factor FliA
MAEIRMPLGGPAGWPPYGPAAPDPLPASPPPPAAAATFVVVEPADEPGLWRRWCSERDRAAHGLLVERYMPYAKALAAKLYARRTHDEIEFDDYQQFAMVGLTEAVGRYEPGRSAKFTTFALPRIQGAVLSGIERLTERQQQIAFRRRVAAQRTESLIPDALCVDPTDRLLGQLEQIGVGVALGFILEGTAMVIGPDHALPENVYARVELRQLHEQVWQMVERLTAREQEVVRLHYRDGRRFEEIAGVLGVTKGRVSQLHRQAVERLRGLVGKSERCDVAY